MSGAVSFDQILVLFFSYEIHPENRIKVCQNTCLNSCLFLYEFYKFSPNTGSEVGSDVLAFIMAENLQNRILVQFISNQQE
jgi:hypothetical protein